MAGLMNLDMGGVIQPRIYLLLVILWKTRDLAIDRQCGRAMHLYGDSYESDPTSSLYIAMTSSSGPLDRSTVD